MANMTLAIPDELMEKMKKFREIRWSEIARQAIENKVEIFEKMNKIAGKSELTNKDVLEISKIVNMGVSKKLKLR